MPEITQTSSPRANEHAVRFYDSDTSLAVIVADFLQEGIATGHPGIVVATPVQRAAIIRELTNRSLNIVELKRSNTLLLLDASDTLCVFMADRGPDPEKFTTHMSEVIVRVCKGRIGCIVRIFGQMVDVLWHQGKHEEAIRLEMLWNQLGQTKTYSLLCGYAMGHFYKGARFDEVCAQHTSVLTFDMKTSRPTAAVWSVALPDATRKRVVRKLG